ncbi:MAG: hypothetical protein A3D67_01505 [Candidatus Lloydbacteria bacterium RIFCSPHIGHO2_02_FULL_51_22]|uniref:DNA methylase N-4/N-6 domain-containing protein n=1 Tax=Candidatus Lloydbacteria bacterium RIFCSPHIGHO2_02_FULL_51_22 TaxID=1798663 RepID=A0A1G2D7Q1_9BACT|nr:MAG: hypothetical protein A3D67_01505 [Candidatus Lloydbacteria bacterium RIFCSPHIGHO2_02_FULL_51_22]
MPRGRKKKEPSDKAAPAQTEPREVREQDQPEIPLQEEFYQMPTRFGNVPVDKEPLGWDPQRRFEKVYPRVSLPFQVIERVSFGHPALAPNKLFFGDNLHIMRMLPSKSIDLIYIDPPFFSGRNYNILYGDRNELRSFTDIWEGGMPGYLIWLNARLYEMKRLLKDTGSIYVHCDWHASHYIKTEMDKIFGYNNFVNEIVWSYEGTQSPSPTKLASKHDVVFRYAKDIKQLTPGNLWYEQEIDFSYSTLKKDERGYFRIQGLGDYSESSIERLEKEGRIYHTKKGTKYLKHYIEERDGRLFKKKKISDVWNDITQLGTAMRKEKIGYPTQKPEKLLERIIEIDSSKGDVVADFFCGGGTTPSVAQKLGRRWVASDISRIAVALTADRVAGNIEKMMDEEGKKVRQFSLDIAANKIPDFSVEHWGIYEIHKLGEMKPAEFRKFVIEAFNGRPDSTLEDIHGYKNSEPLYVGNPEVETRITKEEVVKFAETILAKKGIHKGIMLGWAFAPSARVVAEKIAAREGISLDFVRLNLIPIDSPEFRSHITDKHASYADLVSFILSPYIRFEYDKVGELEYKFDVSESTSLNQNGKIINVQWDFDYRGRFTSTQGYSFLRGKKDEFLLKVTYKFSSVGKKIIACRVQDDVGGEATLIKEIEVE